MADAAERYEGNVFNMNGELERNYNAAPLNTSGSDGTFGGMNDRLSKLEGSYDGLKQSQTIMIGTVAIVSALLLGSMLYLVARVDALGTQVGDLPAKVATELRDINKTLATAITASKQQPPQVIVYPAPLQAKDNAGSNGSQTLPLLMPHDNK